MKFSLNQSELEALYNTPTNEKTLKAISKELTAKYNVPISTVVISNAWKALGLNPSKRKRGSNDTVTEIEIIFDNSVPQALTNGANAAQEDISANEQLTNTPNF